MPAAIRPAEFGCVLAQGRARRHSARGPANWTDLGAAKLARTSGLVGEAPQQADLPLVERPHLGAPQEDAPDRLARSSSGVWTVRKPAAQIRARWLARLVRRRAPKAPLPRLAGCL